MSQALTQTPKSAEAPEQVGSLPQPPLGSLHGYERMASLDNTKAGPGELISFEDVHRALARQRKRAESDLAADPVSASPRAQNSPVNTPDINPVKRANIAPQETDMAFGQNTLCIPRWTVRRPRLLGDFPHAGAVSLSFGAAEPKWLLGQVIMKLSRTRGERQRPRAAAACDAVPTEPHARSAGAALSVAPNCAR